MFWLNGQLMDQISLSDRSIHYGDGCFTTGCVVDGEIQLLDLHLQRLQRTSVALWLTGLHWPQLEQEMKQAAQHVGRGVLKVILTRGCGGTGYASDSSRECSRILMTSTIPSHYAAWREQGIRLMLSSLRLGRNPVLAGLKHLNRLEQVLIRAELDRMGMQEALVLDSEGILIECCAANLFWRIGCNVYTPCLDQAGIAGVMRQHILTLLADLPYQVQEVSAPLVVLAQADEVLICNSLLPLVSVRQAVDWCYRSRQLYDVLSPFC